MLTDPLDRDFLRFLRTRDPQAPAAVFDAATPRLLLVAMHLCRDAATAEDLVQTVFLQALRDAARFDPRQPVLPWLRVVRGPSSNDLLAALRQALGLTVAWGMRNVSTALPIRGTEPVSPFTGVPMRVHASPSPWLVLLVASPVAAQATWTVPSNADLASYIAQAAPGDTLLLGGVHPGFVLDKGLTLRAATGRTTITSFSTGPTGASTSLQIPPGQQAQLVHLDFGPAAWTPWWISGHPVAVQGVVGCEDCTFRVVAGSPIAAALTQTQGELTLRGCTLTGAESAAGLRIEGGTCSVVDCTLTGSAGATLGVVAPVPPMPAATVVAGTLIASHASFTPGVAVVTSTGAPVGPTAGLSVLGGIVRLSDCTIHGGDFPPGSTAPLPQPGAPAILVSGGAVAHARCTLLPGTGTPNGAPTSGAAVADLDSVGIASSGSVRLGTIWTVTATAGASGQPLGFAFWFRLQPSPSGPLVPEPVWGDPMTAMTLGFVLPTAGAPVPFPVVVPNLPSLRDSQLWVQAIQLALPVLRASALAGGVVH